MFSPFMCFFFNTFLDVNSAKFFIYVYKTNLDFNWTSSDKILKLSEDWLPSKRLRCGTQKRWKRAWRRCQSRSRRQWRGRATCWIVSELQCNKRNWWDDDDAVQDTGCLPVTALALSASGLDNREWFLTSPWLTLKQSLMMNPFKMAKCCEMCIQLYNGSHCLTM